MITREQVRQFATECGFGAELRNRHAVKLELFAAKVARLVLEQAAKVVEMGEDPPRGTA